MNKNNTLSIVDKNGNKKDYEIITVFYWLKTNKHYIIYTDNNYNDNNQLNIYASIYDPNDSSKLDNINTEEEWIRVQNILDDIGNRGENNE